MIIFRYIARDLLATTFAICSVLLLVIISGRFVKYLAQAAAGELDPGILFAVIGYRLPGFIELILPLAFFLGILLAYGRLYIDSEMTVMTACGMSPRRLLGYTMLVALAVSLLVGWLSLEVSPAGLAKAEALLNAQKDRGELDTLTAKQFHPLQGGKAVTYVENVSGEGKMHEVFLADNDLDGGPDRQLVLVVAESGYQQNSGPGGSSYLVLENGYRIQGIPGAADYEVTRFEEYGQRLKKQRQSRRSAKADAMTTAELLASDKKGHIAAAQWRMSVPILVLVVSLLAVPLSKTNPRQGRFLTLLPAVLIYIVYLVLLNATRGALEDGKIPPQIGLWWVHLLFLATASLLIARPTIKLYFSRKRQARAD